MSAIYKKFRNVLICILLVLVSGCRTTTRVAEREQTISVSGFNGSYLAVIAAPLPGNSTHTIKIFIHGMAVNPGEYELPEGTTILQAINDAGGFGQFAASKEVL